MIRPRWQMLAAAVVSAADDLGKAYARFTAAREALYVSAEGGDPVAREYILAFEAWSAARSHVPAVEREVEGHWLQRSRDLACVSEKPEKPAEQAP